MSKHHFRCTDDSGAILSDCVVIIDSRCDSDFIEKAIKSAANKVASEVIYKWAKGDFDKIIRLDLLSEGQRECIVTEYQKRPEKFTGFEFSKKENH